MKFVCTVCGYVYEGDAAPACGGAFSTIYYGASKEECHAEMWSAGYNNGNYRRKD